MWHLARLSYSPLNGSYAMSYRPSRLSPSVLLSVSTATVRLSRYKIAIEVCNFDNRWVPPWLGSSMKTLQSRFVTPALDVYAKALAAVSLSAYYVNFMFLSFLQGNLCHLMLRKLYPFKVHKFVVVLDNYCFVKLYFALFLWGSIFLLVWLLILTEVLGIQWQPVHMATKIGGHYDQHRLELLLFEYSGFDPPWKSKAECNANGLLVSIKGWSSLFEVNECCLFLRKLAVETVARKRKGAVLDGTNAQIHPSYEFVAECLIARLGSSNIYGHGWELVSIIEMYPMIWEAFVSAMFIVKQFVKGLYPVSMIVNL